jgi:outer membrane protein assembly factor BamE (lipoprotein component of BamABCDE complex)
MTFLQGRRAGAAVLIGAALLFAGCTKLTSYQGYRADPVLLSSIQPGVDNKDSVTKTLGRPTFVGQFDERDWYYVSREAKNYGYALPKPVAQTVLHIRFDPAGNVAAVEKTGLEKVASIRPYGEKTPTLGRHKSLFEEIFGNLGAGAFNTSKEDQQ